MDRSKFGIYKDVSDNSVYLLERSDVAYNYSVLKLIDNKLGIINNETSTKMDDIPTSFEKLHDFKIDLKNRELLTYDKFFKKDYGFFIDKNYLFIKRLDFVIYIELRRFIIGTLRKYKYRDTTKPFRNATISSETIRYGDKYLENNYITYYN